jgi:hypothetical protein
VVLWELFVKKNKPRGAGGGAREEGRQLGFQRDPNLGIKREGKAM